MIVVAIVMMIHLLHVVVVIRVHFLFKLRLRLGLQHGSTLVPVKEVIPPRRSQQQVCGRELSAPAVRATEVEQEA